MFCPMPTCQAQLSMYGNHYKRCNICGFEEREGRITYGTSVPSPPEPNGTVEAKPQIREPRKPYRSPLKRAIRAFLAQEPQLRDMELCCRLDEQGVEVPKSMQAAEGTFESAYRDPKIKPKLASAISKVRRQLRNDGIL